MYKYIIFDVDGTLIDTQKATLYSLQKMLKEDYNKSFPIEALHFAMGIPSIRCLEQLEIEDTDRAIQKWALYFNQFTDYINLFEGIEELLEKLVQDGFKLGIVTSRTKREMMSDILMTGLSDYFSYVVCADDTEKHKPHPDPLLKLLALSGAASDQVLYIGDTLYDFLCAKSAGIDFAMALWGAKEDSNAEMKYAVAMPSDLIKIFV